MIRTTALLALAALALFSAGCAPSGGTQTSSSGEPYDAATAQVPFEGEASGSIIPEFPETPEPELDGGVVTQDERCCQLGFGIDDREPPEATGLLVGALPVLTPGVALVRSDGGWSAEACIPVNASVSYLYEFRWDAGVADGGPVELDDGGIVNRAIRLETLVRRASDTEPSYVDGTGQAYNFLSVGETCDAGGS